MATKRREKHTKELCGNNEVTFYTVYIGSIQVDRSMRTMQYELRTAVTKEAIVKVCTAAKCKSDIKRPKGIKQINKILTHAPDISRIGVNFTVCLTGLKAHRCDNNKLLHNHSMSSISFASCGETPFKSFVGYVAKDPVKGRACHVFNCFGDACEVVSTIGEAFSIKYDDVLSKHAQYNPAFEFIELNKNDGFCTPLFDSPDSENKSHYNQQLSSDPNIQLRSKSEQNIATLYENLPRKAVTSSPSPLCNLSSNFTSITSPLANTSPANYTSHLSSAVTGNVSLLPRQVENSVFYVPRPDSDSSQWPRTNYCPSPPSSPLGGRRKAIDSEHMSSDCLSGRSSPRSVPERPPHISTPPTKPPRPKMPIYANIDDVERQTHGSATNSLSDDTSDQESTRATPEELRKNLEDLEFSLDEISGNKSELKQPTNPYYKMSWFHGKINREDAERRLRYQGDYLVRSHGNGQFVLSCMDSGSVRHLLLVDPHGQIRTRDRKFVSITDLVTHYATSGECIVSEGCALRIIRPVPQSS